MNIEILSLRQFQQKNNAIDIALPVFAIECEVTPPLENYLDAYEEAVLKLVSIGLSTHGIAGTLNANESLIDEVLARLSNKRYVQKENGKPWRVTTDGEDYLLGNITERRSDESQYGYMFVNAIKKEVLPFFYQGDINRIALFRGKALPAKLTIDGDVENTFESFTPKRTKLREAYKSYLKNAEASAKYESGEITLNEASEVVDLFEDLETFDEDYETSDTELLSDDEYFQENKLNSKSFIRALDCHPQKVYLTMRLIIDPQTPGGYYVESPFDFDGIDNTYFLRQIQWLAATSTTFLGDESLSSFLVREIRKLSSSYEIEQKDYSIFILEKLPLLKVYKDRFTNIYDDMSRIYSLMQNQRSLLEKENIVNNFSRYVVERLFNGFFRGIKRGDLSKVAYWAKEDLECYGREAFIKQILSKTGLNYYQITWSYKYMSDAIGRMNTTRGNSIVEKFINLVVLNYYLATLETQRFLNRSDVHKMCELTDKLNQIRRKVSHDTEEKFESEDYKFYINNVFELINGLLESFKEN